MIPMVMMNLRVCCFLFFLKSKPENVRNYCETSSKLFGFRLKLQSLLVETNLILNEEERKKVLIFIMRASLIMLIVKKESE